MLVWIEAITPEAANAHHHRTPAESGSDLRLLTHSHDSSLLGEDGVRFAEGFVHGDHDGVAHEKQGGVKGKRRAGGGRRRGKSCVGSGGGGDNLDRGVGAGSREVGCAGD